MKNKFYFLNHDDAVDVLVEAWGNPPSSASNTMGMMFPVQYDPLSPDNWGIELSMDQLGFVQDDDAASIDYADLLKRMKADTRAQNEEREKGGYEPITLIGLAAAPEYDAVNKRLHWAKELQFGNDEDRTLNYDVRFLGREGVLVMSYVAKMKQLPEIKASLGEVLSAASFVEGKRYSDF